MIEQSAASLSELITKVKEIACNWNPDRSNKEELWFRGHKRRDYKLLPGILRPENKDLVSEEKSLLWRFQTRAVAYVARSDISEWDWYFCAQHHGLPTRLLDWTESLLAGAYFAVCAWSGNDLRQEPALGEDKFCPVIWMLDAGTLNKYVFGEDVVYTPGGKKTKNYLPTEIAKASGEARHPIAVLRPHTDTRIAAQQSVFTVHGREKRPIEEIVARSGCDEIKLARITLKQSGIADLQEDLARAGVNRMSMFPGLDSIAYCTKQDLLPSP